MASTSSATTPHPAPWKSLFNEHMQAMASPEFVFSSLHPVPADKKQSSPTPYLPRARYVVFRGFWAELPDNKHNQAPMNERVYESELFTFTTDVRMNKPMEIFTSSAGHARDESQMQGSGGGGPCEAVWWVKEKMTQWRVKGEAFIVAEDIEGESEQTKESSGVRTVKSEVGSRMRVVKEEGREKWSWKTELVAQFGNLPPGTRGTFQAPPPGRRIDEPYDKDNLHPGEKVTDINHPVARKNFRVVVIKPEEVEAIDLTDATKSRRMTYLYDDASGEWKTEERWP